MMKFETSSQPQKLEGVAAVHQPREPGTGTGTGTGIGIVIGIFRVEGGSSHGRMHN
jgi:hypothetical protein